MQYGSAPVKIKRQHTRRCMGGGLVFCVNVHDCPCALKTSGLAGNLFHKGLGEILRVTSQENSAECCGVALKV